MLKAENEHATISLHFGCIRNGALLIKAYSWDYSILWSFSEIFQQIPRRSMPICSGQVPLPTSVFWLTCGQDVAIIFHVSTRVQTYVGYFSNVISYNNNYFDLNCN